MSIELILRNLINWILETVDTNNIESFAIAIFGIGVTVFTVLFSFIGSKYDVIKELRDRISNGVASIEEQAQYKIAVRYVSRQRTINKYSIAVCIFSFILFIMCKVKALFFLGNRIFQGALDILYILLILLVVCMVVLVLKEYRRQVKQ